MGIIWGINENALCIISWSYFIIHNSGKLENNHYCFAHVMSFYHNKCDVTIFDKIYEREEREREIERDEKTLDEIWMGELNWMP